MQLIAHLSIHWIGCRCNGIEKEFPDLIIRAKKHFSKNQRFLIYVEKINKGKYICVFNADKTVESWLQAINRISTNINNIKSIGFHDKFGDCSCVHIEDNDTIYTLNQRVKTYYWSYYRMDTYSNTTLFDFTYRYLPLGWKEFFNSEQALITDISDDLAKEKEIVYPPLKLIYNVFELCPPNKIKVIILGMDPYPHNSKEAMGISFSVPKGIMLPSSLRNIYNELKNEGYEVNFSNGDLTRWVKEEGIFLLNTALTVKRKCPGSHLQIWKSFTTRLIMWINENLNNIVWALWGRDAQKYSCYITNKTHSIVTNVHPSGYNTKEWIGSKPFSAINDKLKKKINWNLS